MAEYRNLGFAFILTYGRDTSMQQFPRGFLFSGTGVSVHSYFLRRNVRIRYMWVAVLKRVHYSPL